MSGLQRTAEARPSRGGGLRAAPVAPWGTVQVEAALYGLGWRGAAHVGSWMFIFQDLQTGDILDEVLSRRGYARERGGEERAQRVVAQLLRALAHLHRRNIVHGCAARHAAPSVRPR